MKSLGQLMIILFVYLLGGLIQSVFNLPIPGTVLGLILLFIALYTKIIKVHMIEDICNVLISHMAFLFIPAGVGLMTSFGLLQGKVVQFAIIIFVSTVVTFVVTSYVVKFLRRMCSNERCN